MFPDSPTTNPTQQVPINPSVGNSRLAGEHNGQTNEDPYTLLVRQFVGETRSQLATLTGEIALRNKVIMTNDSYVYGDLLQRSVDVPIGHDFTPVNWLRRVVEIHRVQTMGDGFTVNSSYQGLDPTTAPNPQAQARVDIENGKRKAYAENRGDLFRAIVRDNGGEQLWARMVEGASAVGTSVLKAWYSEKDQKYKMEIVEAVEHFYALWSRSNFRSYDLVAFVYQISKQQAVQQFGVPPDIATSPLGMPLAVLSSANTVEYISTQPMVTIMEIDGRVQGWKTDGHGILQRCPVGQETTINAVIVGDRVKKIEDRPKYLPHFYIFPNKMIRRRPWGLPDITQAAILLNQTYIETLSDWRTLASKVNFPKYKAFGFGMDTQLPKPKARTVEMIGLGEGQDIQPINNPNSISSAEIDFPQQMAEIKEEFVRETGVSQVLFDNPDSPSNYVSNQTMMTAMKSISDQTSARRQLWEPIIIKVFEDALTTLSMWDDNIKELNEDESNWYVRVEWPPELKIDDPAYQTMLINRLNTSTISIQSFMERIGENGKEEIDRIKDELDDPILAAIHGKLTSLLAEYKIAGPPSASPPKTNISLSGVLTPEQETNVAVMHGFGAGPVYGPTSGPQGEQGTRANTDYVDQGMVSGQTYNTGQPIVFGPQPQSPGNPNPTGGPNTGGAQGQQPQSPDMQSATSSNQPGQQPVSAPGSGQSTPTSSQGAANKSNQRNGK